MAISPIVVAWLSNLRSQGILRGGSMLEMGPSDLILYTRPAIEFYVRRHVVADSTDAVMGKLFDSQGRETRSRRCTMCLATQNTVRSI